MRVKAGEIYAIYDEDGDVWHAVIVDAANDENVCYYKTGYTSTFCDDIDKFLEDHQYIGRF